jgi:hypothetical protein
MPIVTKTVEKCDSCDNEYPEGTCAILGAGTRLGHQALFHSEVVMCARCVDRRLNPKISSPQQLRDAVVPEEGNRG